MQKNSELFLRLVDSRQRLENAFYQSLDASVIRTLIQDPTLRSQAPMLGEGRHFQCLSLLGQGQLDLAVLLAKPLFLQGNSAKRHRWGLQLQKFAALRHPLMPPMELIEGTDFFAYVLPLCEKPLNLESWLNPLFQDFLACLDAQGLVLDDYPQLRSCQGHPFVIDFSELQAAPDTRARF